MEVYLTEEAAEQAAAAVAEWKAQQPDYIAVKMTNAEIVERLRIINSSNYKNCVELFITVLSGCKVIGEELYRAAVNPKDYSRRHEPVIAWRDE